MLFFCFTNCKTKKIQLKFLNEYVIQDSLKFKNTVIGGISGIDFNNQQYYMVVDDAKNPRVLVADITIKKDSIKEVTFKKIIHLKSNSQFYKNNILDLEAVFIKNNQLNLASEGAINKGKNPTIFIIDTLGNFKEQISIPTYFKAKAAAQPKHNATFESSSISVDEKGFWVAMEAPLKIDGAQPMFYKTQSPIRITYFNNQTKKATKQFAYQLEKIDKPEKGNINLNGVTAILAIKNNSFLIVERMYQSGYENKGNTIRIFKATINKTSTNTLYIESLKKEKYTPLKKELLFDFISVQHKLTNGVIDNIEGITLGPKLSNGNSCLILVSDDNFQVYGKQLNQFLLLEIEKQ
ncbi:Phytase-like domain-containing protein [Tenacibaculum aestuariivivum]